MASLFGKWGLYVLGGEPFLEYDDAGNPTGVSCLFDKRCRETVRTRIHGPCLAQKKKRAGARKKCHLRHEGEASLMDTFHWFSSAKGRLHLETFQGPPISYGGHRFFRAFGLFKAMSLDNARKLSRPA